MDQNPIAVYHTFNDNFKSYINFKKDKIQKKNKNNIYSISQKFSKGNTSRNGTDSAWSHGSVAASLCNLPFGAFATIRLHPLIS